jgi:cytoskeletal protein CcmA (bactofilin family)
MWTKQEEGEAPNLSTQEKGFAIAASGAAARPNSLTARTLACIGSSLEIKGMITGKEDLQIDGKVDGPISLEGQRLIVGRTGRVNSEVGAQEVIVYGNITGNLVARDRVEIKRDASVVGDIATARIGIEDGAHFKGRIEIDRAKPSAAVDPTSIGAPVASEAN